MVMLQLARISCISHIEVVVFVSSLSVSCAFKIEGKITKVLLVTYKKITHNGQPTLLLPLVLKKKVALITTHISRWVYGRVVLKSLSKLRYV